MKDTAKVFAVWLFCVLLAGCVNGAGASARWWNPTTWFSGSELRKVEATSARKDIAADAVVKAAQKTAHETQEALGSAPASRPVEVASEANNQTVALLDQAAGPLTVTEVQGLRARVAGLLSERAEIRAEAEKQRAAERETSAKTSAKLAEVDEKLAAQSKDLQAGFARENAMANSYRNLKFALYGVISLAVLAYAALFYLRAVYGGMLPAVGKALISLRASHPEAADVATNVLDRMLSPSQQAKIAAHA